MSAPLLRAHGLYRFFHVGDDETIALRDVTLGLHGGEITAVTGPSGSGKSTLLGCLAGLDEPDGGYVEVAGERLTRRSESIRARHRSRGIGMLYQQLNLVAHLSVRGNVRLARSLGAAGGRITDERTLLAECGIAHRAEHRPPQLSGGELARAGLAVALANDPVVLLADEPTGELDSATAQPILDLLRDRADAGAAILVVTHNPGVARQADQELRLVDGAIER